MRHNPSRPLRPHQSFRTIPKSPYGPDVNDMYRRSASYDDRIPKGEKPGDLPVQAPTNFNSPSI
jgi:hypothetical protein